MHSIILFHLSPVLFDRNASNECVTGGDQILSNEHFERRRLTGAVDAEQTEAFIVAYSEGECVDSLQSVVEKRDVSKKCSPSDCRSFCSN